jgi:hypothetical protein
MTLIQPLVPDAIRGAKPVQGLAVTPAGSLDLTPDRVKYGLLLGFGTLLSLHCAALFVSYGLGYDVAMGFVPAFHMDWERNLPTFAATLLLLSCGILTALQPVLRGGDRPGDDAWRTLAVLFVLLSVDEAFQLHEPIGIAVKARFDADWIPMFAWVLPYGALLLVLAAVFLPWFLRLDRPSKMRFAIAAALYVSGALGMELVSSAYFESLDPGRATFRTLTGCLLSTVEESLEFIGTGVFLHALVRRVGGLRLSAQAG